uniref:Uncharacterized protein n=1 Tax=Xiphophorus couchianus TaxID=32473 RepID=A0A3B5L113_9TELE
MENGKVNHLLLFWCRLGIIVHADGEVVNSDLLILFFVLQPSQPNTAVYPPQPASVYPPQPASVYPPQPASVYPPQPASVYPPQPASVNPPQPEPSLYPPLSEMYRSVMSTTQIS